MYPYQGEKSGVDFTVHLLCLFENDPKPQRITEAIAIKKFAEAKARKKLNAAQRLENSSEETRGHDKDN